MYIHMYIHIHIIHFLCNCRCIYIGYVIGDMYISIGSFSLENLD